MNGTATVGVGLISEAEVEVIQFDAKYRSKILYDHLIQQKESRFN